MGSKEVGDRNGLNVFHDEQASRGDAGEPEKDGLDHVLGSVRTIVHHHPQGRCVGPVHGFRPNPVEIVDPARVATMQPIFVHEPWIQVLVESGVIVVRPLAFPPWTTLHARYLHAVNLCVVGKELGQGFESVTVVKTNLEDLKRIRLSFSSSFFIPGIRTSVAASLPSRRRCGQVAQA